LLAVAVSDRGNPLMVCIDCSLFHEIVWPRVIPLQSAHLGNDFYQVLPVLKIG